MDMSRRDKARRVRGSSGRKHQMSVEDPDINKFLMSVEDFKKWLMTFDYDKDGRISQSELRAAIRSRGGWFMTTKKSGRGISEADVDGSGYIDENEIDSLLEFAEGNMGFKFY